LIRAHLYSPGESDDSGLTVAGLTCVPFWDKHGGKIPVDGFVDFTASRIADVSESTSSRDGPDR
jgi:hypothetical protein